MTDESTLKVQVVIAEDQPDLAEIYNTRLDFLGYKCAIAYDGLQALVEIEKNKPQLVLLDLMLPKLSGDQVLKILRESDWGKTVKVLIISNLNEENAPAGLRELGIVDYLVKANMSGNQLDKVVMDILKPMNQAVAASSPVKTEASNSGALNTSKEPPAQQ